MATVEARVSGGVSFALSEEQRELRALARSFAEKEIRPKAAEYDEHQTHPADIIAKAHAVGLMNLHIPESLGGPELPCFDGMLVGEELNFGCSGIGTSMSSNGLAAGPILIAGSEAQKREWLAPLLEAPILGCFGLTEPGAGSDVSGIQTTAVRRGDEYVLNGSKMFITNAGHASWMVCFVSTDRSKGHRGLTALVVPMDTQGVTIEKHLDKMGQRSTDTSAVAFVDAVVPATNRLGEEGEASRSRCRRSTSAARHGDRCGRRRAGCVRARGRVREGARPVRHADRDQPGVSFLDRRHGDRDRGDAAALLAGRVDDRPGRGTGDASTRPSPSASPQTRP